MKKVRKVPTETAIIRSCYHRVGIETDRELCKYLEITPVTLCRDRMARPGEWKLCELRAVFRAAKMSDEDILAVVKG